MTGPVSQTLFQDDDAKDVHAGKNLLFVAEFSNNADCFLQSMPKMPESEKKEESAESREEAKEQVNIFCL